MNQYEVNNRHVSQCLPLHLVEHHPCELWVAQAEEETYGNQQLLVVNLEI